MLHFSKLAAATLAAASLMIGSAGAQTVLRSSDTHPDGYPTVEAVKYFGELVKERTGGRYCGRGLPLRPARRGEGHDRAGALGRDRSQPRLDGAVQRLSAGDHRPVPALSSSARKITCTRSWTAPIGDQIKAAFEPVGLVVLAFYDGGARSFYNTKKPINSDRRSGGHEVPRHPVRHLRRHGRRARRQRHADALRRGLFGDRDRRHRRRGEQLPELRHRQALRGRQVLLARRAHDGAGSVRDDQGRAGTS